MTSATERFSIELPAMYADHHVVEVRRLLGALPGMSDIYASSAFRVVEGCIDPAQTSLEAVLDVLQKGGYMGEFASPAETGVAVEQGSGKTKDFRHTAAYVQTRSAVSFGQNVAYFGRPLWPCPGMGVIKAVKED